MELSVQACAPPTHPLAQMEFRLLICLPATCIAWFPKGHSPVLGHGLGIGDPCFTSPACNFNPFLCQKASTELPQKPNKTKSVPNVWGFFLAQKYFSYRFVYVGLVEQQFPNLEAKGRQPSGYIWPYLHWGYPMTTLPKNENCWCNQEYSSKILKRYPT